MVFHGMIIALSKFDFLSIGQLLYQATSLIIEGEGMFLHIFPVTNKIYYKKNVTAGKYLTHRR